MNASLPDQFTIRVYGIFSNSLNEILVTDEFQLDTPMTKFPGGGLQFGEGPIDCLRREMREECQQEIEAITHYYTTHFYQQALFWDNHQLLSIYYKAHLIPPLQFQISEKSFDFNPLENGQQSFRWVKREALNPDEFTFPIDKHVATLLLNEKQK